MAHSFDIVFDTSATPAEREQRLDCVITPVDRFTGQIITRGIKAEIARQRARARRSLRGHLFFERLPDPVPPFVVEVSVDRSGYFPLDVPITIAAVQDLTDPNVGRHPFDLRPERVVDGESAVIRGRVKNAGGDGVAGATVRGTNADGDAFETRSDRYGTYALRVRLPALVMAAGPEQIPVTGPIDVVATRGAASSPVRGVIVTDMSTVSAIELTLP